MRKLFLTSSASKVLNKIIPLLGKSPIGLKVSFIPTAGDPYGDNKPWMEEDRQALIEAGLEVSDFDLKGKNETNVREVLSNVDIIFVAGGNCFYLLEVARKSGFDKVAKELVEKGTIYIGSSAGSCIAGPNLEPIAIFDDPSKAQLNSTVALNLVNFVILPHFNKEKYSPRFDQVKKKFGNKYELIKLTDSQLIIIENDKCQIL